MLGGSYRWLQLFALLDWPVGLRYPEEYLYTSVIVSMLTDCLTNQHVELYDES